MRRCRPHPLPYPPTVAGYENPADRLKRLHGYLSVLSDKSRTAASVAKGSKASVAESPKVSVPPRPEPTYDDPDMTLQELAHAAGEALSQHDVLTSAGATGDIPTKQAWQRFTSYCLSYANGVDCRLGTADWPDEHSARAMLRIAVAAIRVSGVDPNTTNHMWPAKYRVNRTTTALTCAALLGCDEAVRTLIGLGASITETDECNRTAYDYAATRAIRTILWTSGYKEQVNALQRTQCGTAT